MISYDQALENCLKACQGKTMGTEDVSLQEAVGRICGKDILAPFSVQPFDNSAMDGYAVHYLDLVKASSGAPVSLHVAGTVAAGDGDERHDFLQGTCLRIMTGAPIPDGCDAIVPYEEAGSNHEAAVFTKPAGQGAHIRKAGEDFKQEETALTKGRMVDIQHVLPLATLGVSKVRTLKKPRVAFIATGRELVDDFAYPLQKGQIYNSNRPYVVSMLEAMGAHVVSSRTLADDATAFREHLEAVISDKNPDVVVSSGAVSEGDYDFVRKTLEEMNADIIHHKVRIRPGKPNLFARFPNGILCFGLPGNPVSTAAGLRFFVCPVLQTLLGQGKETPLYARISEPFYKKAPLHMFLKGKATIDGDGQLWATVLEGQESFKVKPFIGMNCWISIPEEKDGISAGEKVAIYPLLPGNIALF